MTFQLNSPTKRAVLKNIGNTIDVPNFTLNDLPDEHNVRTGVRDALNSTYDATNVPPVTNRETLEKAIYSNIKQIFNAAGLIVPDSVEETEGQEEFTVTIPNLRGGGNRNLPIELNTIKTSIPGKKTPEKTPEQRAKDEEKEAINKRAKEKGEEALGKFIKTDQPEKTAEQRAKDTASEGTDKWTRINRALTGRKLRDIHLVHKGPDGEKTYSCRGATEAFGLGKIPVVNLFVRIIAGLAKGQRGLNEERFKLTISKDGTANFSFSVRPNKHDLQRLAALMVTGKGTFDLFKGWPPETKIMRKVIKKLADELLKLGAVIEKFPSGPEWDKYRKRSDQNKTEAKQVQNAARVDIEAGAAPLGPALPAGGAPAPAVHRF